MYNHYNKLHGPWGCGNALEHTKREVLLHVADSHTQQRMLPEITSLLHWEISDIFHWGVNYLAIELQIF